MSQEDFSFAACEYNSESLKTDSDDSEPDYDTEFSFDHDEQVCTHLLPHLNLINIMPINYIHALFLIHSQLQS